MIISASRRTDIPAFYSEWFLNRLKAGYALVPNPWNPKRLGRVELSPEIVDCIVFWTKNPAPMFGRLKEIERLGYRFIIHFTLTPYGGELERALPPKGELLETFRELSRRTSPEQVIWRYDPVIVDGGFSVPWHLERFAGMAELLRPYTRRCVLSFVDPYKSLAKLFRAMTAEEMTGIAAGFSRIAQSRGFELASCAEEIDLDAYGLAHGACLDKKHLERVIGTRLELGQDANQRQACLCVEAVDLGVYNTCPHGCAYCYAVSSRKTAEKRLLAHDPAAPMLTGHPSGAEIVTERTQGSHKARQFSLFGS